VQWAAFALLLFPPAGAAEPRVTVQTEEDVYTYQPAKNGADPMWCSGSTCVVRIQERVFASGLETLDRFPPLNNCRWLLFQRTGDGWQLLRKDPKDRTREPCPLVGFPDGQLFLSVNPTLTDADAPRGPARPEILLFRAFDPAQPYETLLPDWKTSPPFTEHSYRSFAGDGERRELIVFQNIGYTHAHWAFRDSEGKWAAAGELKWPFGAEYEEPQPIRVCYPTVMLKNRAVHFCGVSDIVEPYTQWRAFKKQLTGQEWDYDFRRLFYTWTDDITTGKFHKWIEVASRDKTCGHVFPCDLWIAPDGRVHLLWTERALDERLREKFFPEAKQSHALNYAVLREGELLTRRSLVLAEEGKPGLIAHAGRFHIAPGNRLFVVCFVSGSDASGKQVSENRLIPIRADGSADPPVPIPLEHPLTSFFTATPRAGCAPSFSIDLLGTRQGGGNAIRYACVRLEP